MKPCQCSKCPCKYLTNDKVCSLCSKGNHEQDKPKVGRPKK